MHKHIEVWIADDDSSIRWVLERALSKAGITNRCFADADELLGELHELFDLVAARVDIVIAELQKK